MFVLPMPFPLWPVSMPSSIRNDASGAKNAVGSVLHPLFKLRFGHDCSKKLERISLDPCCFIFFPWIF